MYLNPDCIRDILIVVEDMEYNSTLTFNSLCSKLPSYAPETLNYHCLKMIDAGFLDALTCNVPCQVLPQLSRISDLTYQGHQFLAQIRSDNIWSNVKDISKKVGTTSISAISNIASNVVSALISNHLGL